MPAVILRTLEGKLDPAAHDDLRDLARVVNEVHEDVQAAKGQLATAAHTSHVDGLQQRIGGLEQQVATLVAQVNQLLAAP